MRGGGHFFDIFSGDNFSVTESSLSSSLKFKNWSYAFFHTDFSYESQTAHSLAAITRSEVLNRRFKPFYSRSKLIDP